MAAERLHAAQSFRLTRTEMISLRRAAAKQGVAASELIRQGLRAISVLPKEVAQT